jgi:endonuclease III
VARSELPNIIKQLEAHYGAQAPPKLTGPWEMILWENVAYLVDDERRLKAFQTLKKVIGIDPEEILDASDQDLREVAGQGILASRFAEKLRKCGRIAIEEFGGDLKQVLKWPLPKAKNALQMFPGIGEPGAEKILLFNRTTHALALESNGVRVLVRLGFAKERKSYSTTYRLVQQAVADELRADYDWLIQAHLLLRRHGQELCKRSGPLCDMCPLCAECDYFKRARF